MQIDIQTIVTIAGGFASLLMVSVAWAVQYGQKIGQTASIAKDVASLRSYVEGLADSHTQSNVRIHERIDVLVERVARVEGALK